MAIVVFSGHGAFETSKFKDPSMAGQEWATVPDGTEIYFYTDNLKTLYDHYGQQVETVSDALLQATPSDHFTAGQRCPNYTLSPPTGLDVWPAPSDVDQEVVSGDTLLSELFQKWAGYQILWAACRATDLNEVGGENLGVNAGQDELGHETGQWDAKAGELPQWEDAEGVTHTGAGVARCDAVCPECRDACRWNPAHTYAHRCEAGHQWTGNAEDVFGGVAAPMFEQAEQEHEEAQVGTEE